MRKLKFEIDLQGHVIDLTLIDVGVSEASTTKLRFDIIDDLPTAWQKAIRTSVGETGKLTGEVSVP